jgi:hypothetical protein
MGTPPPDGFFERAAVIADDVLLAHALLAFGQRPAIRARLLDGLRGP